MEDIVTKFHHEYVSEMFNAYLICVGWYAQGRGQEYIEEEGWTILERRL